MIDRMQIPLNIYEYHITGIVNVAIFDTDPWKKLHKGIQSVRIQAFLKSSFEPFPTSLKTFRISFDVNRLKINFTESDLFQLNPRH